MSTLMMPFEMASAPRLPTDSPGASRKVAELCQRWEQMQQQQWLHQEVWQDLIELVMPGHADIRTSRLQGQRRTDRLFDTTAISASQQLAASMMGAVTNPALQWFRLTFRDKRIGENQNVAEWLAQVDDILLKAYNASNFYQAAHTFYLHLGVFGTAAMYVDTLRRMNNRDEAEASLRFKTLPLGTYSILENADGRVDTLFRRMTLTPRQCMQYWGNECSAQMRAWASMPTQQDVPKVILHCVYPREDYDSRKAGNKNMPFASVHLEWDTRHVLDETGYEEFPYLVSRWETVGDDPYGFGPGHMALPDIRGVNFVREMQARMMLLWVQPPLKTRQEGVIGTISLEPLAVNVLQQMEDLAPLDVTGHPELIRLEVAEMQRAIRDMFFADALAGLPPVEASKMTAYEVAQRIEMMQRLMGPAFQRLLSEMLDPLADRTFGLLWRAGALPEVPLEIVVAAQQNQGQLDVEYEGPLAKAQKGTTVRSISETLAVATQISTATAQMDVWDNLDIDGMIRDVAEANGTPRHRLLDPLMVQQVRQARQEQQAAMLEQQMQNEQLKAASPLLRGMQQTSPQGLEAVA